jgi:hypothetical protein
VHGSKPAQEIPSWLVAFHVLICPHVISDFTLSLDAIKAYEYLATTRPVVATPTSGFQEMSAPGLYVGNDDFPEVVGLAIAQNGHFRRNVPDWDDRAREFAAAIQGATVTAPSEHRDE